MPTATEEVFNKALSLPAAARINLVERLLFSLNLPTHAEIDRLWTEESERRGAQVESGDVELIPGEKVFERSRQKYR